MRTEHFQTSSFNVFPNDLNFGNTLFGGKVMSEIDCEMAKVARSIIWGSGADNVVTRKIDLDFIAPAHQADWIIMEADVYELGKSSMKLKIDVYIWNGPNRSDWKMICTGTAVFVALKMGFHTHMVKRCKMKAYKIIVNYDSGDSFNQYPNQECECVHEWDNLDIAKDNLKRISEHNKAVKKIEGWRTFGKASWDDYKNERWYSKTYPMHSVVLLTDDNSEYTESCEWVGYFETMNHCIIIPRDNDMRIDA